MKYRLPISRDHSKIPHFVNNLPKASGKQLALFDADGTLWTDDVADDFTKYAIDTGLLKHGHLWDEYLKVYAGHPPRGCEYALKLYAGIKLEDVQECVLDWWQNHANRNWINEVLETLYHLKEKDYETLVVTGTPTDLISPLENVLPIDKVIGMDFEVGEDGFLTGNFSGISCAAEGKAKKIKFLYPNHEVVFACGNSTMDIPMMEQANKVIWSIYPNNSFLKESKELNWHVLERPSDFVEEEKFS